MMTRYFLACCLMLSSLSSYAEPVWIDVRSAMEYSLDHIEGDPRISHGDVNTEIPKLYPDKDTEIILYCRSGGRAGKAQQALEDLGYTNVTNAGGIDDAREKRKIQK